MRPYVCLSSEQAELFCSQFWSFIDKTVHPRLKQAPAQAIIKFMRKHPDAPLHSHSRALIGFIQREGCPNVEPRSLSTVLTILHDAGYTTRVKGVVPQLTGLKPDVKLFIHTYTGKL